jgi:hypothetical protein
MLDGEPSPSIEAVHAEICGNSPHDRSMTMNSFGVNPRSVLDAAQALFKALGTPKRSVYRWQDLNLDHPVFGLAEHFEGQGHGAAGYTDNPHRGDHMSLPCWSEEGEVFVLETSFHKGEMYVERIDFPDAPAQVQSALFKLLQDCETR